MEALGGLLILLLIGLPIWRWLVWRKRFAVLTDNIADLYRYIANVAKRLDSVEQRVKIIAAADERAHVAAEQQVWRLGATITGAPIEERRARIDIAAQTAAPTPLVTERVQVHPEAVRPSVPAPSVAPSEAASPPAERRKKLGRRYQSSVIPTWKVPEFVRTRKGEAIDWETLIGGSWLNVIGIVVFVVGMALLAQHSLRQFGPVGKIATGTATSIALLLCGILLEKFERYRLLAWTLIGGGWALLYFTAYAAHNIEASRVITDPAMSLLLMGGIAAGILIHSLKYRSQLLTGVAYGLGFFAVAITPLNAYTLLASTLLAVSQIAVLRLLPWDYLALIAVSGTYLNHARWLGETIELRPDFWLSQGILGFYWVLFVTMALIRGPRSRQESLIYLILNAANTIGMLGLSAWQIWVLYDENLYYLTAPAMVAYAGAAGVARFTDRPDLFRFNSFVSVALFAVTLPFALRPLDITKDWLAIYWVLGGIAVIGGGYLLRELLLRLEGYMLCGAAFLAVFAFNLQSPISLADWRSALWWIVPSVIAAFLGLSEWLQRVAGRPGILSKESHFGQLNGYAATAILGGFLWKVSDPYVVGLCWFAAGLVFFEAGTRARPVLRNQGYILVGLSFVALLAIDLLEMYPMTSGISPAALWIVVGTSAATYYYLSWRLHRERRFALTIEARLADRFSTAGTVLLTILAWKELNPVSVALAWAFLALALFEVGAATSLTRIMQQSQVLAVLTFGRLFMANFVAAGEVMGISHRVLTVVPITAIFYYFYGQTRSMPEHQPTIRAQLFDGTYAYTPLGRHLRISRLYSWAGAIALLALSRFELGRAYAVLGMVPLFVAFLILGQYTRDIDFRFQSYVLAGAAFARCWATNAYLIGTAFGMSERVVTMLPVVLALALATAICMRTPQVGQIIEGGFLLRGLQLIDANPHRYYTLLGAALTAILFYYELPTGWVTIAFAIEGLILIFTGILSEERSFRIYGLVLLLVSLLKLITIDVSGVEPIYRILSYIVVGLMLLAASLIYTRYRSAIEKYI